MTRILQMSMVVSEHLSQQRNEPAKNLVIVRAGKNSLHGTWTEGTGTAQFDVLVASYERSGRAKPEEWIIDVPGSKVAGYRDVFRRHPELLERYQYIALFDDDIATNKADIARLFSIGRQYGLDLFQPALSWNSYFTYAATLAAAGGLCLRYTNIVEMMCPVFSASHLKKALPLFDLGYETGIDLVWTRITDNGRFRYAIVDEVCVTHTRPVGSTKERHGFAADETYDRQISELLERFDTEFQGIVTYAAVDRRGRLIKSRYLLGVLSLGLWAAWRESPMPLRHFARFVSDYTRHCFLRPIGLDKIDISKSARAGIKRTDPSAPASTARPK